MQDSGFPLRILDPAWRNMLIAGATTDSRIAEVTHALRESLPSTRFLLLRPAGRPPMGELPLTDAVTGSTQALSPLDFAGLPACQAAVLIINHVGRAAYPDLVRALLALTPNAFLFSSNGLQPLDHDDASGQWPCAPPCTPTPATPAKPHRWVFFRPFDQVVQRIAFAKQDAGHEVRMADTVAAVKSWMSWAEAVFLDWCITDYNALARVLALATQAGLRREGFLALDLADIADRPDISRRLLALNRSLIATLDYTYVLRPRRFLLRRYRLSKQQSELFATLPAARFHARRQPPPRGKTIRLFYHGLHYFWHELSDFMLVFHALRRLVPVRLDVFGRVQESISLGGNDLFPSAESSGQQLVEKLNCLPEATVHGYATNDDLLDSMVQAHFYIGITAGQSLMSRTDFRTGVAEAEAMGLPVLHRLTAALRTMHRHKSSDFVLIDSAEPERSANTILCEWHNRFKA